MPQETTETHPRKPGQGNNYADETKPQASSADSLSEEELYPERSQVPKEPLAPTVRAASTLPAPLVVGCRSDGRPSTNIGVRPSRSALRHRA